MKEFRYTGTHAEHLDNGAPIEPGAYTGPINEKASGNARLVRDGLLLEVPKGTFDAAQENSAQLSAVTVKDDPERSTDPDHPENEEND
jgi:hypothetical protein